MPDDESGVLNSIRHGDRCADRQRARRDANLFQQLSLAAQRDLGDLQILRHPIAHRGEGRVLILRGLLR